MVVEADVIAYRVGVEELAGHVQVAVGLHGLGEMVGAASVGKADEDEVHAGRHKIRPVRQGAEQGLDGAQMRVVSEVGVPGSHDADEVACASFSIGAQT
jgi:hypothetical protein